MENKKVEKNILSLLSTVSWDRDIFGKFYVSDLAVVRSPFLSIYLVNLILNYPNKKCPCRYLLLNSLCTPPNLFVPSLTKQLRKTPQGRKGDKTQIYAANSLPASVGLGVVTAAAVKA